MSVFNNVKKEVSDSELPKDYVDPEWGTVDQGEPDRQDLKTDGKKPILYTLVSGFIIAVHTIAKYGNAKYGPNTWQKVPQARDRYTEAMFRHLAEWMDNPLSRDEESGYYHWFHLCWNIAALTWFQWNSFVSNSLRKKEEDNE